MAARLTRWRYTPVSAAGVPADGVDAERLAVASGGGVGGRGPSRRLPLPRVGWTCAGRGAAVVELDPYQDGPWLLMAELHENGGDSSAAELIRREYARIQAELGIGA